VECANITRKNVIVKSLDAMQEKAIFAMSLNPTARQKSLVDTQDKNFWVKIAP
jgi:hypothetical protein